MENMLKRDLKYAYIYRYTERASMIYMQTHSSLFIYYVLLFKDCNKATFCVLRHMNSRALYFSYHENEGEPPGQHM